MHEASSGFATLFEDLGVAVADAVHFVGGDRCVAEGTGPVRGALEDCQRLDGLVDVGDGLDAGGTDADDADPLALEGGGGGPARGVEGLAREGGDVGDVGEGGGVEDAHCGDEPAGGVGFGVGVGEEPGAGGFLVLCGVDGGVELHVFS